MKINGVKGRHVLVGQTVRIAYNIPTGKVCVRVKWGKSKAWLVCLYVTSVSLENVRFVVNEHERQKVVKRKRRNVHAFAEGILVSASDSEYELNGIQVSYNPFTCGYFYTVPGFNKIELSDLFTLVNSKGFASV
tara:strand:- start:3427 stop:3828 length:402 start_codon:yes stop_codon:yes gene_type:complete